MPDLLCFRSISTGSGLIKHALKFLFRLKHRYKRKGLEMLKVFGFREVESIYILTVCWPWVSTRFWWILQQVIASDNFTLCNGNLVTNLEVTGLEFGCYYFQNLPFTLPTYFVWFYWPPVHVWLICYVIVINSIIVHIAWYHSFYHGVLLTMSIT